MIPANHRHGAVFLHSNHHRIKQCETGRNVLIADKPTYEELEQRVKELEKEAAENKRAYEVQDEE